MLKDKLSKSAKQGKQTCYQTKEGVLANRRAKTQVEGKHAKRQAINGAK